MPEQYTNADSVAFVNTGAYSAGATQADPEACLGGHRAANAAADYAPLMDLSADHLGTIRVDRVICGDVPDAALTITAESTGSLSFEGGATVAIADGETKLLEASDDDWAAVVSRIGDGDLYYTLPFTPKAAFNNALGFPNVTNAQRAAGANHYHAVGAYNWSGANATITVWITPLLDDYQVSTVAQLGASGAGTIQGAEDCFADWPESGWCHIRIGTGARREIVYYTSRTDDTLTVPAAGRARLGTTAAAGGNTDRLYSVPGIRIAYEAPGADGAIQTIANQITSPTGRTWDAPVYNIDSPVFVSAAAGAWCGLWVHREIPVGTTVAVHVANRLTVFVDVGGEEFYRSLAGGYRIADTTIEGYELYVGEDAEPDLTAAPDETSATLPFSHAVTPPGAGETEFRSVVRYRNEYDLVSPNQYSRSRIIDSNGDEVTAPPTAPVFTAAAAPGGEVAVVATYNPGEDATAADTWRVYAEEGADPVPGVDTPVEVAMTADAVFGAPTFRLDYDLPQYGHNVEVRVLVTAYRSGDSAESENTTAATVTTDTRQPDIPRQRAWYIGTVARQAWGPPTVDETTTYDEGENVYARHYPGYTDLYVDTTLVWRLKYDSAGPAANNGLWTTLAFQQAVISGAAGGSPVDVVSATELYVAVADVRRLKIDLSAGVISCAGISQNQDRLVTDYDSAPFCERAWHTLFQVWDKATWHYVTVASLDRDGRLTMAVPIRQRTTVNDFE